MKLIHLNSRMEIDVPADEVLEYICEGYIPLRNYIEMESFSPESGVEF